MRDEFNNAIQQMQPMIFPSYLPNDSLQAQPKRLQQVLIERGLQKNQTPDGRTFFLEYLSSHNHPCCHLLLNNDYYAWAIMSKKPDFQGQRGQL